ncbi:MAG: HAD family phosphatase [Desulfobacterales bacterium]
MSTESISTLFVDIGNVLLSNGWDRVSRKRAADKFKLDLDEMNDRHHMTFDTYEAGKTSLDEYLQRAVFYTERLFTPREFKDFMLAQSQPMPEMLALVRDLKARYHLKVVAVSNEGRELTEHRIRKFNLGAIIDFFVSSCFVGLRKPDANIYRLALNCAQTPAQQVLYIDDRRLFIEVALGLGIHGVHHLGYDQTRAALEANGLIL